MTTRGNQMRWLVALFGFSIVALATLAAPVPRPVVVPFFQPGWDEPTDPDRDCTFVQRRSALTIVVPAKDHDFDTMRRAMNAPRLLRDVEGDFLLEVRVRGDFHATKACTAKGRGAEDVNSGTSAGLFLEAENKWRHRLRLEFGVERVEGEPIAHFTDTSYCLTTPDTRGSKTVYEDMPNYPLPRKSRRAYLRLERRGDLCFLYIGPDGTKWTQLSRFDHPLPKRVKVGLIAVSTSRAPLKVTFEAFRLTKPGAPVKPVAKL
jgi:Protein of unknown function (DUF1349)